MNLAAESMSLFTAVVVSALLVWKKVWGKWRFFFLYIIQVSKLIYLLWQGNDGSLPTGQDALVAIDGDTCDLRHLDLVHTALIGRNRLWIQFVLSKSTATQNVWRFLNKVASLVYTFNGNQKLTKTAKLYGKHNFCLFFPVILIECHGCAGHITWFLARCW